MLVSCLPLSLALLLLLALLDCCPPLQATPPPNAAAATSSRAAYNCSHSYTLRVNSSRLKSANESSTTDSCTDSGTNLDQCVVSNQDGFQRCRTLSEVFSGFNLLVGSDECLRLEMEQGEYVISSTATVSVNYSLVMIAPNGGVVIECKTSQVKPNPTCVGVDLGPLLMFGKSGREGDKVSVVLDGLRFEDCARPFQFDNLDHVAVTNCWFRCAIAAV